MAAAIANLHPRALYAMLQACKSADDRARAALAFIRAGTGAAGGYLFLARNEGLSLAATADDDAPPGLLEYVTGAWKDCRRPRTDDSRTMEVAELEALVQEKARWTSDRGERFERRVLGTHREVYWTPIGLVMLREQPARELAALHHGHVHSLCMALMDAGDIRAPESDE